MSGKKEKTKEELQEENALLRESLVLAHQQVIAQQKIIENSHATMVIQNIHVDRLNVALHSKKTESKRTKFFPEGKGRHLTEDVFIQAVKDLESETAEKNNAKDSRKLARAEAKRAKVVADAEWAIIKTTHEKDVQDWEAICKRLRNSGSRVKDLPQRPRRAPKPKPVKVVDVEAEGNHSSESSGDESDDD